MNQTISKTFDFCYGHRVWSQTLNGDFSEDTCLKCRHLHGHQGEIEVKLSLLDSSSPLVNGMVTDFKHLGWFKKWLDTTLDHKFIMDKNDPLFMELFEVESSYLIIDEYTKSLFGSRHDQFSQIEVIDLSQLLREKIQYSPSRIEMLEGMIFVPFVPTSENIARWIANLVNVKISPLGVRCAGINFNETPKSQTQVIL